MLRLMLLRHAESARPAGVDDHERRLADRGRAESPWVGRYLAAEALLPDLVLVSTARRTQETWELVRPTLGKAVRHRDEPQLYEASARAILAIVRRTGGRQGPCCWSGTIPGSRISR